MSYRGTHRERRAVEDDMCNFVCGLVTLLSGLVLVAVSSYVAFGVVPTIVDSVIESEVVLVNETEQFDRFEEVPFPLTFNVRLFNVSNVDVVLTGGVPVLQEVGPYIYKLYQSREIENVDEDRITYRRRDKFEFDEEASYPLTEDDRVTIANVAFHSILQTAESLFPGLMWGLNAALSGVFGEHTGPIMTVRVGDLLFEGVGLCRNPGLIGFIACNQISSIGANVRNLEVMEDGSLQFAVLKYKNYSLSDEYVISRGLKDPRQIGIISTYNNSSYLTNWINYNDSGHITPSVCNMVRGTDSGIFPPFVDRDQPVFALNTDICRSAELRYQYDTEYEGIPVARFSANEWFLANDEGCFCLNTTAGITMENGCLKRGAMELYSCVGAFLVLSYPHFLYADFTYRNGVVGMHPFEDQHRIFVDLEPNTGTVIRGMKRAQFNVFMRPVTGVPTTQQLRTTLMPIFWIEEGMQLPQEYVDMLTSRLLNRLRLVDILLPVLIAACALVAVLGVILLIRVRYVNKNSIETKPSSDSPLSDVNDK